MSSRPLLPSVGGTLAGGIQDVSAILPLIGTEQCEKHVGSALTGGYLYAATTPLSIFGSLGIVKAGITILFSSISIYLPHISISVRGNGPSAKYLGRRKWLGGKLLKDAGFQLTGTVAPLIGMDGHRFKAETRLVEMLEENHLDDPEIISVDWKSQHWNIMLVISTIIAAALSLTPYIALFLGPLSWRPSGIHFPWLFPALRIIGSCTATVACQFVIQSRVVSLMKNRIIWMTIDRRANAEPNNLKLKYPLIQWDANLPAELCIWSLETCLSSTSTSIQQEDGCKRPEHDGTIQDQQDIISSLSIGIPDHLSVPIIMPLEEQIFNINDLRQLQQGHFPTPARDAAYTTLAWVMLGLSLPATVAGYIGCFTLVSSIAPTGNGPLVWVGLEAALSVLRIIIWASNPTFDEETEVTLGLKLSEHQPMVTTNDYNPHITTANHEERKPFDLVPEREFLQRITPFTGPLDQVSNTENITLYFTVTSDYDENDDSRVQSGRESPDIRPDSESVSNLSHRSSMAPNHWCLYMTVFDFTMQVGVTLVSSKQAFHYFDVSVKYDITSRKLRANVRSERMDTHTWRIEDGGLFDSLEKYYEGIFHAFNQRISSGSPTGKYIY